MRPSVMIALSLTLSVTSHATILFTSVHAFGDSLTDGGNLSAFSGGFLPINPLGAPGRFGNGPTWAEKLATDHLDLPPITPSLAGGTNHAWGGAWTDGGGLVPTVVGQINQFTAAGGSFGPTDLVTIWAGANDFFFGPTDPTVSAGNIGTAVSLVGSAGAEHVLVLNLPDLGKTPDIQATDPATIAGMSALSSGFNAALAGELATLRDTLDLNIYELDVFALNEELLANPADFGFTNVTDPAALTGNAANADRFVFWDGVHPTDPVHDFFAANAALAVGVPEPSSSLLVLSSGLLILGGRRRPGA